MILLILSIFAFAIWFIVLILPWRPWLNGETLEPGLAGDCDLGDVTVLIPARNEAEVITDTLRGLVNQGRGLRAVLVDDGSDDGTADCAQQVGGIDLTTIRCLSLPDGWSGKIWALEQGTKEVKTAWTLLLDADILPAPGIVAALLDKAKSDNRQFVSVMASFALIPTIVYLFMTWASALRYWRGVRSQWKNTGLQSEGIGWYSCRKRNNGFI